MWNTVCFRRGSYRQRQLKKHGDEVRTEVSIVTSAVENVNGAIMFLTVYKSESASDAII